MKILIFFREFSHVNFLLYLFYGVFLILIFYRLLFGFEKRVTNNYAVYVPTKYWYPTFVTKKKKREKKAIKYKKKLFTRVFLGFSDADFSVFRDFTSRTVNIKNACTQKCVCFRAREQTPSPRVFSRVSLVSLLSAYRIHLHPWSLTTVCPTTGVDWRKDVFSFLQKVDKIQKKPLLPVAAHVSVAYDRRVYKPTPVYTAFRTEILREVQWSREKYAHDLSGRVTRSAENFFSLQLFCVFRTPFRRPPYTSGEVLLFISTTAADGDNTTRP